MRRGLVLLGVLLACICTLGTTLCTTLGCNPQTCDARGDSTNVGGIISYVSGANAGTIVAGSIDVFDYNQSCTYDDEEFPVTVGSCTLWATLKQGAEPPITYRGVVVFPGSSSGWAEITPGQMCDLPVLGGVTSVRISNGAVAFSDSTTTLFLTGATSLPSDGGDAADGGGGDDDAFQWQFQANGVPQ